MPDHPGTLRSGQESVEITRLDIDHILHRRGAGLGNGGLGRLAACYLDSLSTLNVPAIGYGIRYEYGIFDQRIENGRQVEITDKWLRNGNPWEIGQLNISYPVNFGRYTESYTDDQRKFRVRWNPDFEVRGIAYDTPVPGYR